jgi:hypothetical protein
MISVAKARDNELDWNRDNKVPAMASKKLHGLLILAAK